MYFLNLDTLVAGYTEFYDIHFFFCGKCRRNTDLESKEYFCKTHTVQLIYRKTFARRNFGDVKILQYFK